MDDTVGVCMLQCGTDLSSYFHNAGKSGRCEPEKDVDHPLTPSPGMAVRWRRRRRERRRCVGD